MKTPAAILVLVAATSLACSTKKEEARGETQDPRTTPVVMEPANPIQLGTFPQDNTTNVGVDARLTVIIERGHSVIGLETLKALEAQVELRTWPEFELVPAKHTLVPEGEEKTIPGEEMLPPGLRQMRQVAIVPVQPLEKRWYALVAGKKSSETSASSTAASFFYRSSSKDDLIIGRFRPDSDPRIAVVQFANKADNRLRLELTMSEEVHLVEAAKTGGVTVAFDGVKAPGCVFDTPPDRQMVRLSALCDGALAKNAGSVTVKVDNIAAVTGALVKSMELTLDRTKALGCGAGCEVFFPPLE